MILKSCTASFLMVGSRGRASALASVRCIAIGWHCAGIATASCFLLILTVGLIAPTPSHAGATIVVTPAESPAPHAT